MLSLWVLAYSVDLRQDVPLLLGITACSVIVLAGARYALERQGIDWSPAVILGVALLLRLPFLLRAPELSDDIYRYLWDGLNLLAGVNPYGAPPVDLTPVSAVAAGIQPLINHPGLVTIYPPGAQLVFAIGALTGSVMGMKCLLVGLDLLLCLVIIRLMRHSDLPVGQAVLYAWHPLPVLEIAGSGHVDGAACLALMTAVLLIRQNSGNRSVASAGALAAGAVLIKLFPVVLVPSLVLMVRRQKRTFIFAFLVVGLLVSVPFLPDLRHGCDTTARYFSQWEFSGWAYQTVRWAFGDGHQARLLLAVLFSLIWLALHLGFVRREKPYRVVSVLTLWYRVVLVFLLLTPTLYPWYTLYLICLLPFRSGPAGLVLSWSVLLGYGVVMYHSVTGVWQELAPITWAIWWAPISACVLSRCVLLLLRATRKLPVE